MSMQTGSHGAFRDGRPLAPARTGPWSTAEIVLRDNAGFLAAELVFVAGIVALSIAVLAHPGPLPGDVGLTLWWQHLALPAHWLATPLEALSTITFPQPFSLILAGLIVVFLLLRRRLDLLVALATVALGLGSNLLFNQYVHRPRPAGSGVFVAADVTKQYHVYSFPSGHVMTAVAFFGILVFLSFQVRRPVAPWLDVLLWVVRIVLLAAIVLMLPSRVLEGEHWPSDGLAGLLWGAFWLLLAIRVYSWAARRWPRLLGLDEPRPRA